MNNINNYKRSILKSLVDRIFNILIGIPCIISACIGFNPGFVGQKMLARAIFKYLRACDSEIILKPTGIYLNGKLLHRYSLHIMKFIPPEGVKFSNSNLSEIKETLNKAVKSKNPDAGKEYYRLYGLGMFVVLAYLAILVFFAVMLVHQYRIPSLTERLVDLLWFVPNIYFLVQTIIFYITRLNHFSIKNSFSEASEAEEKELCDPESQPYVISVVPAYMEEPELLKRTLYSICIQKYSNMKAVLLLGNDVKSVDEKVKENTKRVKSLVSEMKKEFRAQRKVIEAFDEKINNHDIMQKAFDCEEYFEEISKWYLQKSHEFENDPVKYPIDSYLIENTFNSQYRKYSEYAKRCLEIAGIIKAKGLPEEALRAYEEELTCLYKETMNLFKVKPYVFMRTRFENLEQEKTKAGNLTAFSSIIGKTLRRERQENGRYKLLPSEKGFTVKEPKYFASFDSDTIIKPEYIIRKVAFMEREENKEIGLVQSPYIVPDPEETNVASASGIHVTWFLPMSVGFTPLKCAYWLGFNGVIRMETVKKIKDFITDTIIEDTQNSIKMKKAGYEIFTSPEENCITFSPKDINALKVQRMRWASGGFKIAKNLIKSFIKGDSGMEGFVEKALSINYVMGLNFLPIAVLIATFLQSPFNYQYIFVEMLPFLLYLISYVALLKKHTRYNILQMLDGLSITIFMVLYYIAGTFKSLTDLFVISKGRFFATTPKEEKLDLKWVGNLEIAGIVIMLLSSWTGLVIQISHRVYYDVFPVLQMLMVMYGVDRFFGWDKIGTYIVKVNKSSVIKIIPVILRNMGTNLKNQKYSRAAKLSLSFLLVAITAWGSVYGAMDYSYRKNLREEVSSHLYVQADKRQTLDPYEQNKRLGKGLNIASALEAPNEGEWLLRLNEEYIRIIKEAGFDTIRVPISWSTHSSHKSPYKIEERFFERIDWLLLEAKKNNLNVVMDLHNFKEIYSKDTEKHFDWFAGIWMQIAQRYKDCDSSVYYELVNEPRERLTIGRWNTLLEKTITEIRKVDQYHTIVIDAAQWGSAYGLDGLKVPQEEKNVICSFHTYTPQMFTHQGAEYAPDEYRYSENVVWPGPPQKRVPIPIKLRKYSKSVTWLLDYNSLPYDENPAGPKPIRDELNYAYDWGKENKRPIWLGEFGAINNTDDESQIRWSNFVAREAEKRGMTWAYWDFADTCRIYDIKKGQWKEGLLNALMKKDELVNDTGF